MQVQDSDCSRDYLSNLQPFNRDRIMLRTMAEICELQLRVADRKKNAELI